MRYVLFFVLLLGPLMAQTDYIYLNCISAFPRELRAFNINSQTHRLLPGSPYPLLFSADDRFTTFVHTVSISDPGPYLYVSRQGPDQIYGYRRLVDGHLEPLPGFPIIMQPNPFLIEFGVVWMIKHPLLPVLYTSNANLDSISIFQINQDGSLSEFPGSPFSTFNQAINPQTLVFAPDGTRAFLNNFDPVGLLSLEVDNRGMLSNTQRVAALGGQPGRGVAVSSDGRFLYATNRLGDKIFGFEIEGTALNQLPGFPIDIPLDTVWLTVQGPWLAAGGNDMGRVILWRILENGMIQYGPGSPLDIYGAQLIYPAFNPSTNRVSFGGNTYLIAFDLSPEGRLTQIPQPPVVSDGICFGTSFAPEIRGDPNFLSFQQLPKVGDSVLIISGEPATPFYLNINNQCVGPFNTDENGYLEVPWLVTEDQNISIKAYCPDPISIDRVHTVPTLTHYGLVVFMVLLLLAGLRTIRLRSF